MYTVYAFLLLIIGGQMLWAQGVLGKSSFGAGNRIDGDQLLLKDVQHSRPATSGQPPSVAFTYNIAEPITYIEIVSEANILGEVKFSYANNLVVGVVRLIDGNATQFTGDDDSGEMPWVNKDTEQVPPEFDVTITIYGINDTTQHVNPSLLLNRDFQYEGVMQDYDDYEQPFGLATHSSTMSSDFEPKDKIIDVGHRQEGDALIYETFQTTANESNQLANQTVVFYYIDSDFITYVKFVIFDHYANKDETSQDYLSPVAEYSHYSPGTLKATITDYNVVTLFVQMFVYGYRGREALPSTYKPFLPVPHLERALSQAGSGSGVELTDLQRLQLLLLTGGRTTKSPFHKDENNDEDEVNDESELVIRSEDMLPNRGPVQMRSSAPLPQTLEQRLYAMLGLMLYAVA